MSTKKLSTKRQSEPIIDTIATDGLEKFSRQHGADLFGVADLTLARDFIVAQCAPWVGEFPRAVSVGMRVSDSVLDHHSPNEPKEKSLYFHHIYEVVTRALDFLAYDLTRLLASMGYKAFAVPGSTPYDSSTLKGTLSHKLAAHLAGLGWIGKNCLLLTNAFGPRVRFVTVLTDAPLQPGAPLDRPCGKCHVCIDTCPVHAFTGIEFRADQDRELRFDAFKCMQYRRDHPCGICVSSCPKGIIAARKRAKTRNKDMMLSHASCD